MTEIAPDEPLPPPDLLKDMKVVLEECYADAEKIVAGDRISDLEKTLGTELLLLISSLAQMKSAARGVLLTLSAYKAVDLDQDVRRYKFEHENGFSARNFDNRVTIPFLIEKGLPKNVETHWLSQTYSFGGPYFPDKVLITNPKKIGPLLIEAVNGVESAGSVDVAKAATVALLVEFIKIRNAGRVILTRPKGLPIDRAVILVEKFLGHRYKSMGPRLPQLVIYAIYQCLVPTVGRYSGLTLAKLERMKSADRKAGTVGDVVVTDNGAPVEAVEIKHNQKITYAHVAEAIEKVRSKSVRRYYILSNQDVEPSEAEQIEESRKKFLSQNGCEIILNGVLHSLSYYLRMLPDTTDFLFALADLIENDEDLDYEHRIVWNEVCRLI